MARLSLSKAWEETRRIFARDGGLLTAVALGLLLLPQMIAGLISPATEAEPSVAGQLLVLLAALIGVVAQLAIVRLALGPSTTVGQSIRHGAGRFPAAFGALFLLILAIGFALVVLMAVLLAAGLVQLPVSAQQPSSSFAVVVLVVVVAALLLAVKFMMVIPVASAESAGPLGILKRSWSLTNGRYWALLGLELLLLVAAVALLVTAQLIGGIFANLAGEQVTPFSLPALILAFFVGLAQAAFTVFATLMLARVYVQLAGPAEPEVSVPSSGT